MCVCVSGGTPLVAPFVKKTLKQEEDHHHHLRATSRRMWCMPPARHHPRLNALQMHTVVDQPLTYASTGHISCRPIGQEPIVFEWRGDNDDYELDPSGSEAYQVSTGRYHIVATDANGMSANVTVDVEPALTDAVCVVTEYEVTPASTGSSRDGSVRGLGFGLDEGWTFLWTNGAKTREPCLRDVPRGTYALLPLPKDDGTVPTLVHQCPPASVPVSDRPF